MLWAVIAFLWLVSFIQCADQDILTILGQQSGVGIFTSFLKQYPDLVNAINNGSSTVFAPNDDALNAFQKNNSALVSDPDSLEALLQYHVATGVHPSLNFGPPAIFAPTLLTNPNFTNVTGGQRIELTTGNGSPLVLTGLKAPSHITDKDILFAAGMVQVVDQVFTIPVSFPATATKAGLNDLIALMNKAGFLGADSPAVAILNAQSDLSIFAPNNPQFGASYTALDGLSQAQLLSILQYAISQGTLQYSSDIKNNSKIPTLDHLDTTVTILGNDVFINDAKLTTTDYLTSNGVLQIIDKLLDPTNPNARPVADSSSNDSNQPSSSGLSTAASAGVGIALGSILIGVSILVALYFRKRQKQRNKSHPPPARPSRPEIGLEHGFSIPDEAPPPFEAVELDNKSIHTHTIQISAPTQPIPPPRPPRTPQEIDGRETSRISITFQGERPRHVGFQAKY